MRLRDYYGPYLVCLDCGQPAHINTMLGPNVYEHFDGQRVDCPRYPYAGAVVEIGSRAALQQLKQAPAVFV